MRCGVVEAGACPIVESTAPAANNKTTPHKHAIHRLLLISLLSARVFVESEVFISRSAITANSDITQIVSVVLLLRACLTRFIAARGICFILMLLNQ